MKEIKAEHILLHTQFDGLAEAENAIPAMDTLGHELEKHIRKEERELFPLIEKTCDENMLNAIEKILTS
jgi:iron-sulfur cluster repair protein YtfE (RIC family)